MRGRADEQEQDACGESGCATPTPVKVPYVQEVPSLPDVVQVQLVIDPSSDRTGVAEAVRSWFDLGWRRLGGELRDAALAHTSGDEGPARALSPYGVDAGMVFSYGFLGHEIERDLRFDDESWAVFLAILAKLPSALFVAGTLTADGRPGDMLRIYEASHYLDIQLSLRGYSWVTVVPEKVGLSLGGLDGLNESGAFRSVERLPRGGYWLQATERFTDYRQPEAERVFEVLRPHLPANAYASDFRDARRPIPRWVPDGSGTDDG
ncbi:hypothetical protein ACIBF5_22615 [Micromonospora sp. NPDC050417]|uniref:hypothetical protein n=1 Tax=Micromonospora sp. NPDC050417 TaxID=3364280 RepID=UPI00379EFE51